MNATLRVLFDFAVPFTDNQAEQAVRMMKVKMKIFDGLQTTIGADTFASLQSVLSAARKRGWDIIQTLSAKPAALIGALNAQAIAKGRLGSYLFVHKKNNLLS